MKIGKYAKVVTLIGVYDGSNADIFANLLPHMLSVQEGELMFDNAGRMEGVKEGSVIMRDGSIYPSVDYFNENFAWVE